MIILYIICIIAVAALLYLLAIRVSGRRVPDELRVDYAHRGLFGDGIPENSLAAFDAAASAGSESSLIYSCRATVRSWSFTIIHLSA